MYMVAIKVKILGYVDHSYPGWIRCSFIDAFGVEWFIIEKVPVITEENLDEKSIYPKDGFIACIIDESIEGNSKEEIVTINIEKPWGICAESGETIFKVFRNQIVHPYG